MSTSSRWRKPSWPVCKFRNVNATVCGKGIDEVRWTRDPRRVTCAECKTRQGEK